MLFDAILDGLMHAPKWYTRWLHDPPAIKAIVGLPKAAKVLDVGCAGFRQQRIAVVNGRHDLQHFGIDHPGTVLGGVPTDFIFRHCDLSCQRIPYDDDFFDYVAACHVIEHLRDGIQFFAECVRVCRPGGFISVETPSEMSVLVPGFPFARHRGFSTSFYDDPTHVGRPWSPQGITRLALGFRLEKVDASYDLNLLLTLTVPISLPLLYLMGSARAFQYVVWKAIGWNARLLARKPASTRGGGPN